MRHFHNNNNNNYRNQQSLRTWLSVTPQRCSRELFQLALVVVFVRTLGFILCHGTATFSAGPNAHVNLFQATAATTTTPTGSDTSSSLREATTAPKTYHEQQVQQLIADDVRRLPECHGKEPLLEILHSSIQRIRVTRDICERLPHPADIEALYGPKPVVYGMETCADYQTMIQQAQSLEHHHDGTLATNTANSSKQLGVVIAPMVRVAGLYHTGTNALVQSLHRNLQQNLSVWNASIQTRYRDHLWELYNVPWSKHMPLQFRWNATTSPSDAGINSTLVLPVVLIRDPYWWMISVVCLFATFIVRSSWR